MRLGGLNFTTGEVVAVKQIQLTAIPKSEIGDIMVGWILFNIFDYTDCISVVRNRSFEELECEMLFFGSSFADCNPFSSTPISSNTRDSSRRVNIYTSFSSTS